MGRGARDHWIFGICAAFRAQMDGKAPAVQAEVRHAAVQRRSGGGQLAAVRLRRLLLAAAAQLQLELPARGAR